MEFLLQDLDDLDDLNGAFCLVWEKVRRFLFRVVSTAMIWAVAAAAIGLALLHPPIALATSTMLFVILLYRSVTGPSKKWASVA